MNFRPAPVKLTIRCNLSQDKLTFEDANALVRYTPSNRSPDNTSQPFELELGLRRDSKTPIDHTKWKLRDLGPAASSSTERLALLTFHGKDFSDAFAAKAAKKASLEAGPLGALYDAIIDQDVIQLAVPTTVQLPKEDDDSCEAKTIKLTATLLVKLSYDMRTAT